MRRAFAVITLALSAITGNSPAQHHVQVPVRMVLEEQRVFDPLTSLSPSAQMTLSCIRHNESRDKLVDTNVSSGTQGLYQIQPYLWDYARRFIIGLPPTANQATRLQQDDVAYFYYKRNNGFYEWEGDGCV